MAAEQKVQAQQAPAIIGPKYIGEQISVNLKDVDLKDFFRLIHEISGLNVVLDPNVKGTLTIVLDDVPWDQALDIVLKNNELARQLEGNVLRIATVDTMRKEAESRRAQIEAQALAVDKVTVTRFLSYAHSKDVVPTVKSFLTQRGDVISDDRTNALTIEDIPSVMPSIDRLLLTRSQDAGSRNRSPRRCCNPQLRPRHRYPAWSWLGRRTHAVGGADGADSIAPANTKPDTDVAAKLRVAATTRASISTSCVLRSSCVIRRSMDGITAGMSWMIRALVRRPRSRHRAGSGNFFTVGTTPWSGRSSGNG